MHINDIPQELKTGVRVIKALKRTKDGGPCSEVKRIVDAAVTRSEADFDLKIQKMLHYVDEGYRIYASINERNVKGASRTFADMLLDAIMAGEDHLDYFMSHTGAKGVSALMQPSNSKGQKYFLFDVDDPFVLNQVEQNETIVSHRLCTLKTPNGFHVITEPFNPTLIQLPENVELKKDSLYLVAY